MQQPTQRFDLSATRTLFRLAMSYASRLGQLVDAVLRGLDRILGGVARPVLQPVPARVPSSGARRRS